MWTVGTYCWFLANRYLTAVVTFPIVTAVSTLSCEMFKLQSTVRIHFAIKHFWFGDNLKVKLESDGWPQSQMFYFFKCHPNQKTVCLLWQLSCSFNLKRSLCALILRGLASLAIIQWGPRELRAHLPVHFSTTVVKYTDVKNGTNIWVFSLNDIVCI